MNFVPSLRGNPRVVLLASMPLAGCLTLSDFDLDRPVPEQALVGSTVRAPLPPAFPLALSLDLSTNLARYPRGVEVKLDTLTLTITDAKRPAGDADDFAFVDTLRVYVTGSTLPRVEIAHARQHGATQTLEFGVADDLDLAPYVREATKVDAVGSGTLPSDDISFDGRIVFRVHPM